MSTEAIGTVAPDDGYWQSLLQDAEQAEEFAAGVASPAPRPVPGPPGPVEDAPHLEGLWQWAHEIFARDSTVEGIVTGFNRGGLLVKVRELSGFVPASHMVGLTRWTTDQDRAEQLGGRIGETLRLKVIEDRKSVA